ncbi:undecaprenyl-diphosphate phosphatase [Calidifontibacter sp. DB0510]|uniref:Undecaprenyl-diphosphatase n=1 Tax=Metallococcus carri TaxID=1656884 RepID=A0A967B9K6_9MICO|nr:undecaprenyl-diphosphate phosphatase [Metallococcus carri]NHN57371.1 undecaprenyl-diphosphate phosphatase [Metallococcus carri]NOP39149.1 undecaprenyl-diphosphate phosphatase [Calidifontibacter sp. DB2511S]
MSQHLSWLEAGVVGAFQGVAELFPISSLGHSVLIPALVGGSWARDLNVSTPESPYLAYIVGLHVATAIALIAFFWRDWVRLIGGLFSSIRHRRIETRDERLIWLLIIGTIPVGLVGLLAEHWFRTTLARPIPTAIFLIINGIVLITVEQLSSKRGDRPTAYIDERVTGVESDERLARMPWLSALVIGASQILALAPGISRSGIAMTGGMVKGLTREDAARFSFLLATPVILAAGVLKIPDLLGPLGDGIRPQVIFGSVLSGVGAYLAVRFFTRYVATRSLRPFGVYCIVAGAASIAWLTLR